MMSRRARVWQVVATLFALGNAAGAGMALAASEWTHAGVHVALIVGTYLAWQLLASRRAPDLPGAEQLDERLQYLQQSVDALALEVERIGEAQRFEAKLRGERAESPPLKRGM
jgi:hypothetical protein